MIFSRFPSYAHYDELPPIVTEYQNFDSLLIPRTHSSRNVSDTYYINKDVLLRTHTSAHQAQLIKAGVENDNSIIEKNKNLLIKGKKENINRRFLAAADVYRRDEIDSSHYPIFHQMEGVTLFSKENFYQEIEKSRNDRNEFRTISSSDGFGKAKLIVETVDDTAVTDSNPFQSVHKPEEIKLLIEDMKETMNDMVSHILSHAMKPPTGSEKELTGSSSEDNKLKVRWIEAYFPFTSPSWELEVWWNNEWLEICGCGIMRDELLVKSGAGDKLGWAFGFGLDRLAMILFGIPDIRLFWSSDKRFLNQFSPGKISQFKPFSKYSSCFKDVSFWTAPVTEKIVLDVKKDEDSDKNIGTVFFENDLMDIVREVAGDLVDNVTLVDKFVNPKTNRTSLCYRINYCAMDR
ncbi:Phenylalanine-tRNA ligase, mitochondrial [Smittium mucronatum]|uniref:phenylalanine--tRNA ligase n=1 Tax=Smittium mucronatum TaxID=133383 RepID=A0A1R0GYZ8_9FUNG|nr:Phenylalanine-tRNA ligase, mitochondrial [Smittium mucronatum]